MRASRYELPYQGLWAGAGVKQPQANGYRGEPGAAPGAGVILAQAPAVLTSDRIEVPFAGYRDPSGARRLQSAVPEALQTVSQGGSAGDGDFLVCSVEAQEAPAGGGSARGEGGGAFDWHTVSTRMGRLGESRTPQAWAYPPGAAARAGRALVSRAGSRRRGRVQAAPAIARGHIEAMETMA